MITHSEELSCNVQVWKIIYQQDCVLGRQSLWDRGHYWIAPEGERTLKSTHCHFNKPLLTYSCLPQTAVSVKLKQNINNPSSGYWTAGNVWDMDHIHTLSIIMSVWPMWIHSILRWPQISVLLVVYNEKINMQQKQIGCVRFYNRLRFTSFHFRWADFYSLFCSHVRV